MILVTGGAGFIGSHIVEALLARDCKVRILDNLSTGKKRNIESVAKVSMPDFPTSRKGPMILKLGKQVEFFFGDISDIEICRGACVGVSYVFHLAALGSVQRSVEDPLASHRSNATGTLNILQGALEAKVKRVIYASSSSVYGNIQSDGEKATPKKEDLPPCPESPYAASKLMGEIYLKIFSNLYGLETVSLRYFNVFGCARPRIQFMLL